MKSARNVNIDELVEKTVEYLRNENLSPLDLNSSARGADNIMGKLCSKFFGDYSLKDSMYISTIWKRDQFEFRSRVIKFFPEKITTADKANLEIKFNESEQKILQNLIVIFSDGRKRFKAEFSNFISKKIQENGIKCWLKVNSNWFRKENGRKYGDYWSGKFSCVSCANFFKMRIESNRMDRIIIENIVDNCSHLENIKPPNNRISGVKRKLISHEIVSNGVGNFRAENFLKEPRNNYFSLF